MWTLRYEVIFEVCRRSQQPTLMHASFSDIAGIDMMNCEKRIVVTANSSSDGSKLRLHALRSWVYRIIIQY